MHRSVGSPRKGLGLLRGSQEALLKDKTSVPSAEAPVGVLPERKVFVPGEWHVQG